MHTWNMGGLELAFDSATGQLGSVIQDGKAVAYGCGLWEIELRREGRAKRVSLEDAALESMEVTPEGVRLTWRHAWVRVWVEVRSAEGAARFSLSVEAADDATSVFRVIFPVFRHVGPLSEGGSEDFLVLPWQNGSLIRNPIMNLLAPENKLPFWLGRGGGRFEDDYPASFTYQFLAYYAAGGPGCYWAAEDGRAHHKIFGVYREEGNEGMRVQFLHHPENMGRTRSYRIPYDIVFIPFQGDWQAAACLYRRWATAQPWCGKRVAERALPPRMVDVDLWRINHRHFNLGKRTEAFFNTALALRDRLQCRLGLHWYGWNMGEHDVHYPDYIDDAQREAGWPRALTEWNERFSREGIVKIPYTNARLWELGIPSWHAMNARAAALKREDGSLYHEPWGTHELKPMCPATPAWQRRVADFCEEYVVGHGFDGVYLDQIASFNATLCFDSTHPHALGGGPWWNDGYHAMVRDVRARIGGDKILTTESCCEAYVDVFDLFLILDQDIRKGGLCDAVGGMNVEPIPLFSMIYGDYANSYGSALMLSCPKEAYEYGAVQHMLWGMVPTLEGGDEQELASAGADDKLEVMRRTAAFYREHKAMILQGRCAAVYETDAPSFRVPWAEGENGYAKEYPGVMAVRWESPAHGDRLLAYNFLDMPYALRLEGKTIVIPAKAYACAPV